MARKFFGNTSGSAAGTGFQPSWPKNTYQFVYDFTINGGAQGSIQLTQTDGPIPDKFIIQNAFIDVITPLGSGGAATAALTSGQTADDLVAATAISGAPWSSGGLKATLVLLATIGGWIKTTAQRNPAIVVGTANLNAGKFYLYLEGFQGS